MTTVDDFYIAARTVLVKSEKYFDLYDQVFAHVFEGVELPDREDEELDFWAHSMLDEWLKDPKKTARALGEDEDRLSRLSAEELLEYFKERLREQKGRHDGGSKWIGTRDLSSRAFGVSSRRYEGGRGIVRKIGNEGGGAAALP